MSDHRNGEWIDEDGHCRVCNGEIPFGHRVNCDYFKLESKLTASKARVKGVEQSLELSRENEAGVLTRWEEALTAPLPAEGVMPEPAESLYRRTEKLRMRVKELEEITIENRRLSNENDRLRGRIATLEQNEKEGK